MPIILWVLAIDILTIRIYNFIFYFLVRCAPRMWVGILGWPCRISLLCRRCQHHRACIGTREAETDMGAVICSQAATQAPFALGSRWRSRSRQGSITRTDDRINTHIVSLGQFKTGLIVYSSFKTKMLVSAIFFSMINMNRQSLCQGHANFFNV